MKKLLWKSDLWEMTLAFGALTLICMTLLAIHLAQGENGEAFTMGVVGIVPATLTLLCAFTDRSGARKVWIHPHVERDMLERGILEDSCLNPDNPINAARIARLKDEDRPPDIG